jgi:hypothetical protein
MSQVRPKPHITGKQLPPQNPKFGWMIKENASDSKARRASARAARMLADLILSATMTTTNTKGGCNA